MDTKTKRRPRVAARIRRALLAAMTTFTLFGATGCTPQTMQQMVPLIQMAVPLIQSLLGRGNTSGSTLRPPNTSFQPQIPRPGGTSPFTSASTTCRDASCASTAVGGRDQVRVNLRDGAQTRTDPVSVADARRAVSEAEAAHRAALQQLAEARQGAYSGSRVRDAEAAVARARTNLQNARDRLARLQNTPT
jgi:hypothetical protein